MACECGSTNLEAAISTHSLWRPIEVEDDRYYLNPLDFESPDYMDVEVHCPECGKIRVLSDTEWEMC